MLYSAKFCKKGSMIYISHLDLMRLFRRAMRRASLPFVLTEGFTPRVKISVPQALKLGRESDSEHMQISLAEEIDPLQLQKRINRELPEGIKLLKTEKVK